MIRKYVLFAVFSLAVSSFVACGDSEDGGPGSAGGSGGTGGGSNLDVKKGWCESISVDKVSAAVGQEMKFDSSNGDFGCAWELADEEAIGSVSITVVSGRADEEMIDGLRDAMEKQGKVYEVVPGAGDKAYFSSSDGNMAALMILKNERMLHVDAFLDLADLQADQLVEIADLVFAAL